MLLRVPELRDPVHVAPPLGADVTRGAEVRRVAAVRAVENVLLVAAVLRVVADGRRVVALPPPDDPEVDASALTAA